MILSLDIGMYTDILTSYEYNGSETGGLLCIKQEKIISFYVDRHADRMRDSYTPTRGIARRIDAWYNEGCDVCFIHSHPEKNKELSTGDLLFGRRVLENNSLDAILMAVVVGGEIYVYEITSDGVTQIPIMKERRGR